MITLPAVRQGQWIVVSCPWCGHDHSHSPGDGPRLAHCWQGEYHLTETSLS